MSQLDPNRRYQNAYDRARADWAAADPARCAALAGCTLTPDGIRVPYFGRPHLVTHPDGVVTTATGAPAHVTVAIVLLHTLLTADGAAPAERWIAFRDLPDGLFYSQAFADHAEKLLAQRFGAEGLTADFRRAAAELGGTPLDLADASFRFDALPRLPVAVLVWAGDEDFAGQARLLFDAHAGHYLPTEDLSGLGDWLAHKLAHFGSRSAPAPDATAH